MGVRVSAGHSVLFLVLIGFFGQSYEISLQKEFYQNIQNFSLIHRFKRQSPNCRSDPSKFQCERNQNCINNDQICDGIEDCQDGSDEQQSVCQSYYCPGYLFRCDYGACISADQKCDGRKDCKDNSDEKRCTSTVASKINTNCRSDEFECDNGQCIEIDGRCDGVFNCRDKSDETASLCLNTACPGYTYKCKYGACVDGDSQCNGRQDCVDNSDESDCGTVIPPIDSGDPIPTRIQCVTPAHPTNGYWSFLRNSNERAEANQKVNIKTTIVFRCNDGYTLSSTLQDEEIIYCKDDGQWHLPFPECKKLCPPQSNRDHVTVHCKLNGGDIPCNKATGGALLTFECANYFEPEGEWSVNTCSADGSWYYSDVRCREKCGEKRVSHQPLVVGGSEVLRGSYPWVVAIYSNRGRSPASYTNICGGSLLSTSIVISAAHCVTDQKDGKAFHKKFYKVGSGKYYNKYMDERDQDTAQYADISDIIVHEQYVGAVQNFRADIALLKLTISFALSKVVQPVCLNRGISYQMDSNSNGVVTGWGYTTAKGDPSDVLKEIDLPQVDNAKCRSEFDPEFANRYLLNDKFCAGYVNSNMSVCKGDSGGGFVVRNGKSRYYIYGVVSLAQGLIENNQQSCNVERRALFTNVNYYNEWIQGKMQWL